MSLVARQQHGVESIQVSWTQLLETSATDRSSRDVQADVPAIGLEGGRLDRVLHGREPGVSEEGPDRLPLRFDVCPVVDRGENAREFSLRLPPGREAAAAGPGLVEFRTNRAESVGLHREVVSRVMG